MESSIVVSPVRSFRLDISWPCSGAGGNVSCIQIHTYTRGERERERESSLKQVLPEWDSFPGLVLAMDMSRRVGKRVDAGRLSAGMAYRDEPGCRHVLLEIYLPRYR